LVKTIIVGLTLGVVLVSFQRVHGVDSTVALMVAMFSLKILEMKNARDVKIVIYLCYFIAGILFLFHQDIFYSVYQLLCFWMITTVLVSSQSTEKTTRLQTYPLKIAFFMLLQAIPVLVVLFLILPRLPPLWSVPVQSASARTGVSDSMSPGDISKLGRSSSLAFRVKTSLENFPEQEQWYWRGLVLDSFDGRKWSPYFSSYKHADDNSEWLKQQIGESNLEYEIILEPTFQRWLFALTPAYSDTKNVLHGNNYLLSYKTPVSTRLKYRVKSRIDLPLDSQLSKEEKQKYLMQPYGYNPKTIAWGKSLTNRAPIQRLQAILDFYKEQPFVYTLEPPKLGKDTADEFLFSTQRGFCEHYAGSFAVAARAAGLPTRVVVGYQGGEQSPYEEGHIMVYQYNAHAWNEVWLEDYGWIRVDPTAAAIPLRLREGLNAALEQLGGLGLSGLGFSRLDRFHFIKDMQQKIESMNYAWYEWVNGYDAQKQYDFLSGWVGNLSFNKAIKLVSITLLSVFIFYFVLLLWLRFLQREKRPEVRYFYALCLQLEKQGYKRALFESPTDFGLRVAENNADIADAIKRAVACFNQLHYGNLQGEQKKQQLQKLKQLSDAIKLNKSRHQK
jgi:transglutaminase-like putative cysteine protease